MKEQDSGTRIKNFNEVPYGYSEEEAVQEASRCLQCKNSPCVRGCPAEIDIPAFIRAIKEKRFASAVSIIRDTNNLPAVCGRVCPQEDQCEKECVLMKTGNPINIGSLERFAADWERENKPQGKTQKPQEAGELEKVAVIGAGPAGLTCAADLAKMGYRVTVFEGLHKPGGVLTYGIPEFRLPKAIVGEEVEHIRRLGVDIKLNYVIGRIKTVERLREEGYKAFFIATGAGLPYFLGIEGENLNGVYSANEFLTRVNLMKAYRFPEYDTPINVGRKAAVIGAGNVAMDSARCALRLGAEKVYIVYRRTEAEMPARIDEIHHAKEEGIEFHLLRSPVRILGDDRGNVRKMVCRKNRLGEPDDSGRRRPVAIEGSEFEMGVDTVIIAVGNGPNPLLLKMIGELKLGRKGNIEADGNGRTNIEDIFAGGDIVTGSATVIAAMGAGKQTARAIDRYLRSYTG
ncbi:MAG: glutamate synthase (NADPH), homotetrameric [Candidatus Makaraimicrobium thalassicum]|nr:MAG: glutamate synthase (NADPH), homotetrameric [Candidatus Omnitrophota bacterium]